MAKKIITIIIILLVIAVVVVGIILYKKSNGPRYTLNGTIMECSLASGKPAYTFIANKAGARPQYFSDTGAPVKCEYTSTGVTESCMKYLSSLRNCTPIYRTDRDTSGKPPVYSPNAPKALQLLSGKVK